MPPPEDRDDHDDPSQAANRLSPYLHAVVPELRRQVKQAFVSSDRNRLPILAALRPLLPERGAILEIASGTGQQIVTYAAACPGLTWLPSDPDPMARASIAAWIRDEGLANVAAPQDLDVTRAGWARELGTAVHGIVSANLLHVAGWDVCEGLVAGAAVLMDDAAFLLIYGPFMRDGRHTSEGNRQFDWMLGRQDPDWGLRDVEEVAARARRRGLRLDDIVQMPANNLSLVFRTAREAGSA